MGAKKLQAVGDFDRDEIHELAMDAIEHDPARFQTRAEIDMEVVNAWVKAVKKDDVPIKAWPPVQVTQLPDGRLVLTDGFHRWELHRKLGRKSIRAVIVPGEDEGDVLLKGIKANLDNLKFRAVTEADRMHAAKMMVRHEEFRLRSNKWLGEVCGLMVPTVVKIRNRLRDQEGIPIPDRVKVILKDGSIRWQHYSLTKGKKPHLSLNNKKAGQGRPDFRASVDGKNVYLGTGPEQAETRLSEILEGRESGRKALSNPQGGIFVGWLNRRGVPAVGDRVTYRNLGGFLMGNTIAFPFSDENRGSFLVALGEALLYRKAGGCANAIILVGYRGGWDIPSFEVMANEPLPIRVLTPEQVVAEFGPKSDAGPDPEPTI